MDTQNHNKKFLTLIFAILSLIFLVFIFSIVMRLRQAARPIQLPITAQISPTVPAPIIKEKGSLTFKVKNNETVLSQKKPIILYVYADSDNQPITGYDAILKYDSTQVEFVNHKNLQPDLQIFTKKEKDRLIITGVKNLNSNTSTVFTDSSLVELIFQPQKTGQVDFSFDFTYGSKKDSNLITDKTTEILGKIEGIKLYIGQELTLAKNQPTALSDGKITLKLTELVSPDEKCRDCISSAKVEVKKDGQTKEIEFKSGGIAGYLINQQEAFSYQFKIDSVGQSNIGLIWVLK
jgi:hypothetical protein